MLLFSEANNQMCNCIMQLRAAKAAVEESKQGERVGHQESPKSSHHSDQSDAEEEDDEYEDEEEEEEEEEEDDDSLYLESKNFLYIILVLLLWKFYQFCSYNEMPTSAVYVTESLNATIKYGGIPN